MIFTNARLIFPDEIRDGLDVAVEHGKIAAVSARSLAHRKHVHSDYLNNISLGICLVGDFNRDQPTRAQLDA